MDKIQRNSRLVGTADEFVLSPGFTSSLNFVIRIFSFLLVLQLFSVAFATGQDCVLKKSQDSIFVYTCKVSDSRLKSIKSTFQIRTNPGMVAAYLLDVPAYTQWQYNTIGATVLKRISADEIIYRSEIKAPWPVSNRDLVMHLKILRNPVNGSVTIQLKSMPGFIAEKEDVVRVPRAEGEWLVEPISTNEVRISYHFLIDPGGSVPVWLINMALAEGPYETFFNLTQMIEGKGK